MRNKLAYTLCMFAVSTLAVLTVGSAVYADVDVDVRGGAYTDAEAPFVGAGILTPVGHSKQWFFNPNAEAAFGDDEDVYSANADFHYDVNTDTAWTLWFGAGPALLDRDLDPGVRGDDGLDVGANLLVGGGAKRGDYRPFVQGKVTVSDDSEVVLAAGIRF